MSVLAALKGFGALLGLLGAFYAYLQQKQKQDQDRFDTDADKMATDAAQAKTPEEYTNALKELQSLDDRL